MTKILPIFKALFVVLILSFASAASANNLVISNVTLEDRNASANTAVVQFNISWDHSWRISNGEHDAVWVFVKILQNSTAPWLHGKFYTAGTNPVGTSPGTNSDLKIVIPSDKIGAFISRTATGNGNYSSQKVRLVVDYGTSGIADTDTIQVKVFGIEMVYVPEGPFYIGGEPHDLNEKTGSIYGGNDAFISTFNSAGTFQWSKRLGGTGDDTANAITTDSIGNVLVSGAAYQTTDLNGDGDTADSSETGNTGIYRGYDVFASVFNSAGTFQWSKRLGGTSDDYGQAITTGITNNVFVAGYVDGNSDLNGDADTADTNETGSTGVYGNIDAFVSVFNSTGTFQWAKRLGGTSGDVCNAVVADNSDNVTLTGYVIGTADLNGDGDTADTGETGNTGVYGTYDIFISAFNSAGTFRWAKRLGGTDNDFGLAITTNSANNVLVAGQIARNVDLNGDGDTADTNETGNTGVYASADAFISVFNSAGTFQWSKRLGGTGDDYILAITTDGADNVIVAGYGAGTMDLNGDGDTADTNETGSTGVYAFDDGFISVFNSAGTFQWSERLGGLVSDYNSAVTTDSANNVIVAGAASSTMDLNGDGDTADSNETGDTGVYGSTDAFISAFNSAGTFQWSKRLGGTNSDSGSAITADSAGNVSSAGFITINADLNGDATLFGGYAFYKSTFEDTATQITTAATSVRVDTNSNDDIDSSPVSVTGLAGITGNTSWPNGYAAFYLMKYEISQGQYRDFLNTLSRVQQGNRVGATVSGNTVANYYVMSNGTSISARNGIRAPASGNGTSPTTVVFGNDLSGNGTFNETDDGANVAMNWMNWPDLAAYADWAGLRPLTELEYEKACRGPNAAINYEKAWGGTGAPIKQATSISNSGRSTEVAGNAGAGLAVYNNHASVQGPLRTGFAATNATTRISAGAGFYGNMELSGNVLERAVTLGNSTGRAFTGTNGDGTLTSTASYEGNATNNDWPGINATTARGVTAGTGGGWRGGSWASAESTLYLTDRVTATGGSTTRDNVSGGRVGRTAP